jgi:hypothetical protein
MKAGELSIFSLSVLVCPFSIIPLGLSFYLWDIIYYDSFNRLTTAYNGKANKLQKKTPSSSSTH